MKGNINLLSLKEYFQLACSCKVIAHSSPLALPFCYVRL